MLFLCTVDSSNVIISAAGVAVKVFTLVVFLLHLTLTGHMHISTLHCNKAADQTLP